jgi:hypothetical protein
VANQFLVSTVTHRKLTCCPDGAHRALVEDFEEAGEWELAAQARRLFGLPLEEEATPPWWAR